MRLKNYVRNQVILRGFSKKALRELVLAFHKLYLPRKQAGMQIKMAGPLDEPVIHYTSTYHLGYKENEGKK